MKREDALDYHASGRPGKIAVVPTKPLNNQRDLALAYSPGVAVPCLEIAARANDVYKYTAKGNLVAVVTDNDARVRCGEHRDDQRHGQRRSRHGTVTSRRVRSRSAPLRSSPARRHRAAEGAGRQKAHLRRDLRRCGHLLPSTSAAKTLTVVKAKSTVWAKLAKKSVKKKSKGKAAFTISR